MSTALVSAELQALLDLAGQVFSDSATRSRTGDLDADGPRVELDTGLWATLDKVGLTRLSLPEDAGGSGGTLGDSGALLTVAGRHAAPVPLAESDLLASWLLHTAGLAVPSGPLTAVRADLAVARRGDAWQVRGSTGRVAWARSAALLVVLAPGPDGDLVLAVDPSGYRTDHGRNVAGEPRDRVHVDCVLPAAAVAVAPAGAARELRLRGALARSLLLVGAADDALARTVEYVGQRAQFGRPIGRFQAVQHHVAEMAGEVAAARAAAEGALGYVDEHGFTDTAAGLAVAVAKARSSQSATVVARLAHQVHGAIGFTLEHSLRIATTRLWAWRDEDGDDGHWHTEIGTAALAAGPDGLWPLIAG